MLWAFVEVSLVASTCTSEESSFLTKPFAIMMSMEEFNI